MVRVVKVLFCGRDNSAAQKNPPEDVSKVVKRMKEKHNYAMLNLEDLDAVVALFMQEAEEEVTDDDDDEVNWS